MEKVTWSTEAKQTVASLGTYLAEKYGEEYAERILDRMESTVEELAEHPTKGRPAAKPGQRRWQLSKHHYVVYELLDHGINIVSLHSYKRGQ